MREDGRFDGLAGETLIIAAPPGGTLKARRLMLIGLGEPDAFRPEAMRLVGRILYREAGRLGVAHPYFAPTILDGGVKRYATGEIAEQVTLGVLDAWRAERWLAGRGAADGPEVEAITYLAGHDHEADTRDGIAKAIAEAPAAP